MLSSFFTDLASGLTSFVASIVNVIVKLFTGIFCTTATEGGAITGISPVGEIAVAFLAMYVVYKMLPTVIGWFKLKSKTGRKARRKAK